MEASIRSGGQSRPRGRARTALVVLAALVPVLLLLQVDLAGLFLMGGQDVRMAHVGLGRMLQFFPVLLAATAFLAQMPRRFWLALGALWVVLIVQAWLPLLTAADATGWIRAIHPINGFLLLGLSVQVLRLARGSNGDNE
jgi:hypothetical protein